MGAGGEGRIHSPGDGRSDAPEDARIHSLPEALARLASTYAREELATATGEGPAWLVFVYDPNCDVCQKFLPFYEGYETDSAEDALLRVATVKKSDLVRFQIEDWAWTHSPTVLLVKGGAIIQEWGGEDSPIPGAVRERIANEGEAYFESMRAAYQPLQ